MIRITVANENSGYHSSGNCIIETRSKTLVMGFKNSVIPTDGSVTGIGAHAFELCEDLTSITIPGCVKSIGMYAFHGCSALTRVYFKGTAAEWNKIFVCVGNDELTSATRCYYAEAETDAPKDGGHYWHYVNGVPTEW